MGAVWATRLRWRLRGASQWPAFLLFTAVEAVLLNELPVYGRGPGGLVPGLLLAGFGNLLLVAVLAPLLGRVLRARRADLPRAVADDFAGTALLAAGAVAVLGAGLAHRPVVLAERGDRAAQHAAVAAYVEDRARAYREGIALADTIRLADDLYRTCVPGRDPRRPLCLYVRTDRRPAAVTPDSDRSPNSAFRRHGGFE